MPLKSLRSELRRAGNPEKAKILSRFFKTGKGQYGEGDVFLGVTVPETRRIAIKHKNLPLKDAELLLKSKIHEERLCAVLLLVHNYNKCDEKTKKEIVRFYMKSTKYINNWDLVDLSADKILGKHLLHKERKILYRLAKSKNIWERRIAMVATFQFIKNNQFNDALKIAEMLLDDKHDLIQKAVGWMLREVGKRNEDILIAFLKKHYNKMSRTILRYAIERFPEKRRKEYMKGMI